MRPDLFSIRNHHHRSLDPTEVADVSEHSETPSPAPPPILVRKYGGSSLETAARIKEVARDLAQVRRQGFGLVVVVSAMGKTTNELARLADQVSATPPRREMDMLLSVGERITMSLLSMALAEEGCPAISFTGSQCGIITDTSHSDARILEVKGDRVRQALAQGYTVVVAGFQGVSQEKEITTLGRGGSDTTAVALAAALGALRCEILKDVDGVMSADPSEIPDAWQHTSLDSGQMQDIASTGCGVVHVRAVEYAALHGVELVVRSSFHEEPGTVISPTPKTRCGDQPAAARENRYRPLAMSVHRDLWRLGLSTPTPARGILWRDLVLTHLDPTRIVAEWMDCGSGFRWEVVAPQAALLDLVAALPAAEDGEAITIEDKLTSLSFAGGQPDSWLEVQRHLTDLLAQLGCDRWRMRADGTALRVLLPAGFDPDLPRRLHQALLPE